MGPEFSNFWEEQSLNFPKHAFSLNRDISLVYAWLHRCFIKTWTYNHYLFDLSFHRFLFFVFFFWVWAGEAVANACAFISRWPILCLKKEKKKNKPSPVCVPALPARLDQQKSTLVNSHSSHSCLVTIPNGLKSFSCQKKRVYLKSIFWGWHLYTCKSLLMVLHLFLYSYVCAYTGMYIRIYVCIFVCICTCIHVYTHVYICVCYMVLFK